MKYDQHHYKVSLTTGYGKKKKIKFVFRESRVKCFQQHCLNMLNCSNLPENVQSSMTVWGSVGFSKVLSSCVNLVQYILSDLGRI